MSSAPFLYIRVQLLSKYEEIKEKGGGRVRNECYIFFPPDIWIRRRKYCLRDRLIAHDKNFGYIRNIVHGSILIDVFLTVSQPLWKLTPVGNRNRTPFRDATRLIETLDCRSISMKICTFDWSLSNLCHVNESLSYRSFAHKSRKSLENLRSRPIIF